MAQSIITFFLNNNVAIIQFGFAIIFVLVVFVILRSFKEDKEESTPVARSISERRKEMESLEDKVEEKTIARKKELKEPEETNPLDDLDSLEDLMGVAPEISQEQIDETLTEVSDEAPKEDIPPPPDFEAAAGEKASTSNEVSEGQREELAEALKEKEKVIADLRTEIKTLQESGGGNSEEAKSLKEKVTELTDKLAEYEIIEDDIANLSFYKSENIKLKNELDKLRGTNMASVEAAVKTEETASAPEKVNDDDILSEFQEAVKQKDALEESVVESPKAEEPAALSAPSEADLLAEFETAVEAEVGAQTESGAEPEPKSEKTEPPKEAATEPQKAEEVAVDPSKLVKEVEQLAATEPPKAEDDGKDNNQKLIEEFENFLNKT